MEKKFNIVVGEDGTVKLPDAVLEKLEVKPGEEVRFEVDDNFYAVRLLSRIEAERLDYLNWMHNKHCPSIEEMIAESRKQATQNIVISRILDGMPAEKIAEGYEVSLDYVKQLTHQLKMDIEEAKAKNTQRNGIILKQSSGSFPYTENCRCLCIEAYRFFARFLMSVAIEGSASSLARAAAASVSTGLALGVDCSARGRASGSAP